MTTEAINSKSVTELEKHLATDFEIAGQTGEIAKMVLSQLIIQLDETVLEYKEIDNVRQSDKLTLIYNINYKGKGEKNATFVFNNENKLQSVELFELKVKTLKKNDTSINFPEKDVIVVPFQKAGNLIAVEVVLNDKKRMFLLDSGSPKVILNSHYTSNTANGSISTVKGAGGNISGINITTVKNIDFAGITMENQEVLTMELSHLEKELNTEIYGLIGYEFIKDYDILFDYKHKEVVLIKPDYFNTYKEQYLKDNTFTRISLELRGHIPVVEATVQEQKLSLGLDCGAESNLIHHQLLATLSKSLKKQKTDILRGADKSEQEVVTGNINKIIIGNTVFKNMKTMFSDISHLNASGELNIDGLVGYELLSKQKTLISFERKELVVIN
ncbi:MAG: hypothetical protein CSB06_02435 [Bacteroidia bacterium]|nr:MAG: hypothetical protein CSB06_02435 [Bacteroidia bacterium]